jgi:hypothetical protein
MKTTRAEPSVKTDPRVRRDELLERAHTLYVIPEAKVVLIGMLWRKVNIATVLELTDLCNSPLHEVTLGMVGLYSAGVNIYKGQDKIVLGDDWSQ